MKPWRNLLWVLPLLSICCHHPATPAKHGAVFIQKEGKQYVIYRNGRPFSVKGASGYTHLQQLRQSGGNTIRTWDTVNLGAILDEAEREHLAVIAGLPMPGSAYLDYYYKDTARVAALYRAFEDIVQRYKKHPALLMWCLGNELGFSAKPGYSAFYNTYDHLLQMIHDTDRDHPVTTTMANFNLAQILMLQWHVPDLDLVSFNTFGKLGLLNNKLNKYTWLWDGPFMVTEWGAYGPWEVNNTVWGAPIENTSTKKAEHYQQLYAQLPLNNPRCLGALVFYWGQKQETTPTWFSLFDENGAMSEAVAVMEQLWTGHQPVAKAPQIRYMLLNNKGAADNIVIRPELPQEAEILMQSAVTDSLSFRWEIWQEDWFSELKQRPLKVLDTLMTSAGKTKLLFKAPLKQGPYRLYVKVTDQQGHFSTTNTPFYVME
ncbi:hypothetical protein F0L74_05230 [Chitinophaga agrisoli]|uniref:Glycoside hydrolase family 2 catalytic domain-containing protein n=1 Tax=Chitinophaga agrisoli TaxID=2607653 RepID=A0A5B2W4L2_9BACT|nr:glycoside hydrolase family 2 TIM barrel-domain containing protein [Chitinophaga agrisoli]KAA2245367.1 hypothetical protein F0L74_05230 [Chitinophaga agrisoli]